MSLENFDDADILTSLDDGRGLLQATDGSYWYFNQTTLLHGAVGLTGFDNQFQQIVPLEDGTALIRTGSSAPANCAEAISQGYGIAADLSGDCYVNWTDFGIFAGHWLETKKCRASCH